MMATSDGKTLAAINQLSATSTTVIIAGVNTGGRRQKARQVSRCQNKNKRHISKTINQSKCNPPSSSLANPRQIRVADSEKVWYNKAALKNKTQHHQLKHYAWSRLPHQSLAGQ